MNKRLTIDQFLELNGDIVMSRLDFITHCRQRGLLLHEQHLDWYEELGLIKPAIVIRKHPIYVPQQAYMVGQIEQVRLQELERPLFAVQNGKRRKVTDRSWIEAVKSNLPALKKEAKEFGKILDFILRVRHYYISEVEISFHTGKITIVSEDLILHYGISAHPEIDFRDWGTKLAEDKQKFDAAAALKQSGFSEENLLAWGKKFVKAGRDIDPLKDSYWHAFLNNVRVVHVTRIQELLGPALLAQDYYRMADVLIAFLEHALHKRYETSLFDQVDPSGKKWKMRRCQNCDKLFEGRNFKDNYCASCKEQISKTNRAAWVCKGCQAELIKHADGNALIENFVKRSHGAIKVMGNVKSTTELLYGGLKVTLKCPCGAVNVKYIEAGWM